MFKNVIVGVDGGEGGRDAIVLAKLLRAEDGKLTLACVYHRDPHVWRGSSPPYEAAEEERAHELLEKAQQAASVNAQLRSHGSTSVGRGLHELAEASGADLLVLGSSRRGLLGRVLIGDDTRAALNGAPCAVAIAPAGHAQHPALMHEIGVGYVGSPEAEHALRIARNLAGELETKLSAFEAVSFPAYMFTGPPIPDQATIEKAVQAARERVAKIEDAEPHAAYGKPAEELALYSASLDLLVIGSRSYGPIGRLVHGSVAQQLARTARCPLLVLTRAAREADATRVSLDEREATAAGAET
ncbi:MAG: universal stress protein [Solirubrobacterales bacterium]|nr:universal stress protein [Solirubrobacterales bacterium]